MIRFELSLQRKMLSRFRELCTHFNQYGAGIVIHSPTPEAYQMESEIGTFTLGTDDEYYDENSIRTCQVDLECNEERMFYVIQVFGNLMYEYGHNLKRKGFQEGQEASYQKQTDLFRLVDLCHNLNLESVLETADVNAEGERNEFIIQDILHNVPNAIRQLQHLLEKAKAARPDEHYAKPTKLTPGEEYLFTFERKLERKKGRSGLHKYVIGRDEHNHRVALDYFMLYKHEFEPGKQYVITSNGLHNGKYSTYHTFTIVEADSLL